MLQQERRIYLIKELLKAQQEKIKIPKTRCREIIDEVRSAARN